MKAGVDDTLMIDPTNLNQVNEVSEIKWCKYDELLALLVKRSESNFGVQKRSLNFRRAQQKINFSL